MGLRVILTGATGLVGEGVLLECLENPLVDQVLSLSRRPSGRTHPKLTELLVPDFLKLDAVEAQLTGWDACLYCAGISSRGLTEAEYTRITYDTPLHVAGVLARLNPKMVFCHVSGQSTDGTGEGRVMWARVKGKAENALVKLPFRAVYNFRPGFMKPTEGQRNVKGYYRAVAMLFGPFRLVFPRHLLTLQEVARAMLAAAAQGAPKPVLEAPDMFLLAHPEATAA